MTNPYEGYSDLESMSVSERIGAFERVAISHLQAGCEPAALAGLAGEAIEDEQYELAEAIKNTLQAFAANPQLSLF